ncbi:MAG: DUF1428 domain-containing protein [Gammaproteobacteria bacterium]|nr:DUF1428 domain-containing protein [Gammaproteobacteria bacterium]MCY4358051.1 DUF1428 domain-containing protein [Gammaproteobacteria bacterium]
MPGYIDAFVHPIPRHQLDDYLQLLAEVARIWKQYGALDYQEFLGDDLYLEGTRSFTEVVSASETEVVLFGWVSFNSRETRNEANRKVAADPQIAELMAKSDTGFDPARMIYGGMQAIFPPPRQP